MISYTQKNIYVITLIFSTIIYLVVNYFFISLDKIDINNYIKLNHTKQEQIVNTNWMIEIPKISLKAPIAEGTTEYIMNKYVGHFEETSKTKGNIGLFSHNNGYQVNYFENIKKLKKGDEIIYQYEDLKKIYLIDTIEIIKDTDWSYLEETEENKITLITCIENEQEYRRCIQGIENTQINLNFN